MQRAKKRTNLLSDEIYLWPSKVGYNKVFNRISKIFNFQNQIDFSLIIITREQTEIFLSMYSENQEIFTNLDPKFSDFDILIEDLFIKRNTCRQKFQTNLKLGEKLKIFKKILAGYMFLNYLKKNQQ